MSQVVNRIEWRVLDNAKHARRPGQGFTEAPPSLGSTIASLRKRGLIVQGAGGLFLLTTNGVAVHQAHAGKYTTQ